MMLFTTTFVVVPFALLSGLAVAAGSAAAASVDLNNPVPVLPDLTTCSQSCIGEGIPVSGCSPTNTTCLCTSMPYADAVGACLLANCTVVDALETQRFSAISCGAPVRNQGALTRGVSWSMFALATISIFARMFSRMPSFKGSGFSWDDWTIFICWLILIPSDAILHHMTNIGLGQDIWMLPYPSTQVTEILYLFWVSEYTYVAELSLTKIAILLLYLRMWPTMENTWFRTSCYILIALLSAFAGFLLLVLALECQPIDYNWTRWDLQHQGSCIDLNALIFASAGINIFFDIAVIVLPIPRLLALSIPGRKKIAVLVTFSIGFFVTFCSIIRLRSLAAWGSAPNLTWLYNPIAIWSNVEMNVGVVCACVPAVAGLLQRIYVKLTGHQFSASRSQNTASRSRSAFAIRDVKPGAVEKLSDPVYEMHSQSIRFSDGNITLGEERGGKGGTTERVVEEDAVSLDETRPSASRHGPLGKSAEGEASQKMIDAGYSAFSQFPRGKPEGGMVMR